MVFANFLRPRKQQGDLAFEENSGAFDYACKYLDCRIYERQILLALVESIEFTLKDGRQSCSLRVAGGNGGRVLLLCETLNDQIPILKSGDLVAYEVIGHFPESQSSIAMLSIPGFIVAKLEPAWSIDHSGWRVCKARRI